MMHGIWTIEADNGQEDVRRNETEDMQKAPNGVPPLPRQVTCAKDEAVRHLWRFNRAADAAAAAAAEAEAHKLGND